MRSVARRVLVIVLAVSLVAPWSAAADARNVVTRPRGLFSRLPRARWRRAAEARAVQQLLAQGKANLDNDEPAAAERQFAAVLRFEPCNVAALIGRGTALQRLDRLDESLADFQAAIRLDPGNSDAYCGRGAVYSRKEDLPRAFADCDEAVRLNPGNSDAYCGRGYADGHNHDLKKAVQDFDRAIELNAKNWWAYYGRGVAEYNNAKVDRALADFSEAISLKPREAELFASRCKAFVTRGDLKKAVIDANAAIRREPDNAEYYRLRGSVHEKSSEADLARKDFDRSREIGLKSLLRELALPPATDQPKAQVEAIEERIVRQVKSLEYDEEVGRSVVALVRDWNVVALARILETARANCKNGALSRPQLVKVEQKVATDLARMINVVILPIDPKKETGGRELSDVSRDKTAWCQGATLLYFVLGNAIGLSTEGLDVEITASGPNPTGTTHDACLVQLPDGATLMVDATGGLDNGAIASTPFNFDKVFRPCGSYWELKDKSNPLGLHRVVQPANTSALIAQIYLVRATCSLNNGNRDAARETVAAAVKRNPQSADAYNALGQLHLESNEIDKAIAEFTKAIAIDPRDARSYADRGSCHATCGNLERATSDFCKALDLNPQLYSASGKCGCAYLMQGKLDEAILNLDKAINAEPSAASTYAMRGYAWAQKAEQAIAVDAFTMPSLEPSKVNNQTNTAIASSNGLFSTNVATTWTSSSNGPLNQQPNRAQSQPNSAFGSAYFDSDHSSTAESRRLTRIEVQHDIEKVIADYSEAIRLDRTNLTYLQTRAWAYDQQGDLDKAIADLSAIIRLDPKSADAYKARGDLYAGKHEINKAAADYAEAERLKPSDDRYR